MGPNHRSASTVTSSAGLALPTNSRTSAPTASTTARAVSPRVRSLREQVAQAFAAIAFACRVLRVGHAVGHDAEQFAGLHAMVAGNIGEAFDRAQRRTGALVQAQQCRLRCVEHIGVVMTGVAVREFAGGQVDDPGEHGDEIHFRVVARDFRIGRAHQFADRRVRPHQRRALVQRLADRHEHAGRQSLACDIANQEEHAIRIQAERNRRDRRRLRFAGSIVAARSMRRSSSSDSGARQDAGLDALRGLEFAFDVGRLHALRLHDAFQRLPAPRRLGQRQHEQHAEQDQQSQAAGSPRRTAAAASGTGRMRPAPAARRTRWRAARHCAASSAAWPRSAAGRAARTPRARSSAPRRAA